MARDPCVLRSVLRDGHLAGGGGDPERVLPHLPHGHQLPVRHHLHVRHRPPYVSPGHQIIPFLIFRLWVILSNFRDLLDIFLRLLQKCL